MRRSAPMSSWIVQARGGGFGLMALVLFSLPGLADHRQHDEQEHVVVVDTEHCLEAAFLLALLSSKE